MKLKNVRNSQNHLKLGNKGIALLSVLIAVAFVSVIGSALLYITYLNFEMKVLNLNSKENFYETDGKLVDVTSKIRNAVNKQDPSMIDTKLKIVETGSHVDPLDPTKVIKDYSYDVTDMLVLAGYSSAYSDATGDYTFTTTGVCEKVPSGVYTTYRLKNFEVKHNSDKQKTGNKDYTNKVSTDIVIKVKEVNKTKKGKGVGEFSMLMDNSIDVTAAQFTHLTMYGDAYFSSYDGIGTFPGNDTANGTHYTKPGQYPGKPAVKLNSEAKVNIFGEYCVIFGELYIGGDSCFYVGGEGNLTVYGDIIFDGNGTMICGGKIYQPSSPLPGRTTAPSVKVLSGKTIKDHLYLSSGTPDDVNAVSEKLTDDEYNKFCDPLKLKDDDTENDGVIANILNSTLKYKQGSTDKTLTNFNFFKDAKTGDYRYNHDVEFYNGRKIAFRFWSVDQVNQDIKDSLVFMGKQSGTKMVQSNLNSTILSIYPIKVDVQHGTTFTKMGSDMFDYMLLTDTSDNRYDPSVHELSDLSDQVCSKFKSGNKYKMGDFFVQSPKTPNDVVNEMLGASTKGSGGKEYYHSLYFVDYVKDAD